MAKILGINISLPELFQKIELEISCQALSSEEKKKKKKLDMCPK